MLARSDQNRVGRGMNMDHTLLSLLIGCTALITSAASLRLGLRNREENKKLTLLNKKTQVLEKVYERRAKLGHLALVVAQQLKCYADNPELKTTPPLRFEDASKNIEVIQMAIEDSKKFAENVRQLKPTDIEPWEDMLATSAGFLVHVKEDIEKEKIFLSELREMALKCRPTGTM